MVLQRQFDPKSPHGKTVGAGEGLYEDAQGDLNIGEGWGIVVTEDEVAVDKAVMDETYIEVEVTTGAFPVHASAVMWVNTAEVYMPGSPDQVVKVPVASAPAPAPPAPAPAPTAVKERPAATQVVTRATRPTGFRRAK